MSPRMIEYVFEYHRGVEDPSSLLFYPAGPARILILADKSIFKEDILALVFSL